MTHNTRPISPLRQRMIEDMALRKLAPKTQSNYLRAVINFTRFLGRSPDTATSEDLRRYLLCSLLFKAAAETLRMIAADPKIWALASAQPWYCTPGARP